MEKSVVKNEFECQEKCIDYESRCKSCNVYLEENDVICELNNKTRLMKAADFKEERIYLLRFGAGKFSRLHEFL